MEVEKDIQQNENLDTDPIFGGLIEDPFILGKTKYSLNSLYEWFLVRKCLINPMTNTLLTQKEQDELVERLRNINLLPPMNYEKVSGYKLCTLMEKQKILFEELKRLQEKYNVMSERIQKNEDKLNRARKKDKYIILIQKQKDKRQLVENSINQLKNIITN